MSTQSDALLSIVEVFMQMPEHERAGRFVKLHSNPIHCTHRVFADAEREAEGPELDALRNMKFGGLIVVSDNPAQTRRELAPRIGYENRAMRRARHGKAGKRK